MSCTINIDVVHDDLLTLAEAAKLLETRTRKPGITTVWRWARKGVAGVRLAHVQVGKTMYTTPAALNQFARDLAAAKTRQHAPADRMERGYLSDRDGRQAVEEADAELAANGI